MKPLVNWDNEGMFKLPLDLKKNVRRYPPLLGEHTDEVLGEIGYSRTQIENLKREKVICLGIQDKSWGFLSRQNQCPW